MGKSSKTETEAEEQVDVVGNEGASSTYEDRVEQASVMAQPMATRKMSRHIKKLAKQAYSKKKTVRGIKNINKTMKKSKTGICVLAGDVNPFDMVAHLPVLCEDNKIPYCWVPSVQDLNAVAILVQPDEDYEDLYDKTMKEVKSLPTPVNFT